jgi:hypothetical protein
MVYNSDKSISPLPVLNISDSRKDITEKLQQVLVFNWFFTGEASRILLIVNT